MKLWIEHHSWGEVSAEFCDPLGAAAAARELTCPQIPPQQNQLRLMQPRAATLHKQLRAVTLPKPASCWLQLCAAGGASTWRRLPPLERMAAEFCDKQIVHFLHWTNIWNFIHHKNQSYFPNGTLHGFSTSFCILFQGSWWCAPFRQEIEAAPSGSLTGLSSASMRPAWMRPKTATRRLWMRAWRFLRSPQGFCTELYH